MIDFDKHVVGPTIAVFGQPVTYRPKAGGSYAITGVFDEAYHETAIIDGDRAPISDAMPVLGIRAADLPVESVQGDLVDVPSVQKTYRVKDPQPDGHGHVKLLLTFHRAL